MYFPGSILANAPNFHKPSDIALGVAYAITKMQLAADITRARHARRIHNPTP